MTKENDEGWVQVRLMGDQDVLQSIAPDLSQQVQPNKRDKYGNQGRLKVWIKPTPEQLGQLRDLFIACRPNQDPTPMHQQRARRRQ